MISRVESTPQPTHAEHVADDLLNALALLDEPDPLDFGRPAQQLKTCEMSSQRMVSRLAARSCSYTWGSLDAYRHAAQVARHDQTHDGSRDNDTHR